MHTHLLLDIIQKGVEELKQITDSFKTDTPELTEIDIATSKTETLLKEFYLLKSKIKDAHISSEILNDKDNISYPPQIIKRESTPIITNNDTKTVINNNSQDKVIGESITSTDLNNIININDKFQFSIELFNNDMKLYKETINKLNSASSFENAKKIISSFNWNTEDETVIHFYEILTRKFNYNV